MEEKLNKLYSECLEELKSIGIDVEKEARELDIKISKRNNKRYGVCKGESPDKSTMYIEKTGRHRIIKYAIYNIHHIEISPWVMELKEDIIKNTIIHEIIHSFPYCNNHGKEFKEYSKYINQKLGYNISTVGNKKEDYEKSSLEYNEEKKYNYKIQCEGCGEIIYRQRYNRGFTKKYRCGKCGSKFKVYKIEYK